MSSLILPARFQDCPGCARRREKIVRWTRKIVMPWHMEPEWLAAQYRDEWVKRRDRALAMVGIKGKISLRKYQRGNFNVFPAGTQALISGCSFTASTVPNLSEFNIEPTDSYTQARLHTDGDWYWNESTNGAWGGSRGTWQGSCAVADYDTRWNHLTGTVPNANISGTDGVWHAATTSAAVGYSRNFGTANGTFNLECRDGASLNVLFTDAFSMFCSVDPRN